MIDEKLIYSEITDDELEDLALKARELTIQRFGKTIKLYAPVYLSNSCVNACRYCGFNKTSGIKRITLSVDQTIKEALFLIDQGHRHLLLVAGEDPGAITAQHLEKVASKLRPHVAKLLIETQAFDETSYKRLVDAGVDGVTLYQETYHPLTYKLMHPAGPKSDYNLRFKAISDAGKAGMRFLGIGALLGLYDWRYELAALINHARELKKKYWQAQISISFPRIRDCASDFDMPCPVTDKDLVKMIVLTRLSLPDADITISTREPAELRDHLVPLGVTQMSAGSVTSPGGYTINKEIAEQFRIEDTRKSKEFAKTIEAKGYQPLWKDWI